MKKRIRIISGTMAVLLVICYGVYLLTVAELLYHPKPFREREFDRMIAEMKARGALNRGPAVVLPPEFAGLSITGRVYITDGLVFVPSWIGRKTLIVPPYDRPGDDWVEGYLYSEKPPSITPTNPFVGILNVPGSCSPREAPHESSVGNREMAVSGSVGRHWYSVDSFS